MISTVIKIQPVILCGGSGTRLWPISTSKIPKQFISLGTRGTLLEETIRRVTLIGKQCSKNLYSSEEDGVFQKKEYIICDPLLLMHQSHKLPSELSMHEPNVIYEEYANDTAVAVAKAAIEIKKRYNDESIIMLVLPADHYIYNVDAFVSDIIDGITNVTFDNIVLYGIDPIAPETKYGYIIPMSDGVKFREKPNSSLALELINQGALWNSGLFAANTDLVLKCLTKSNYNIMDSVSNPREGKAPSFDIAVLQEYNNIYAHHCSGWRWSDVGTWDAFTDIPEIKDEMKESSNIVMAECNDVNILKRSPGNIVIIGCSDLLVVTNGPDILIIPNKGDYNNQLKDIATRISK